MWTPPINESAELTRGALYTSLLWGPGKQFLRIHSNSGLKKDFPDEKGPTYIRKKDKIYYVKQFQFEHFFNQIPRKLCFNGQAALLGSWRKGKKFVLKKEEKSKKISLMTLALSSACHLF